MVTLFFRGFKVKVRLQWHRFEAPAESSSPLQIQLEAEALLQLIWSSVTCWDMKPTLQSSSNLHTHTEGYRHLADRYTHKHLCQYVFACVHTAHLKWNNCLNSPKHTHFYKYTVKKGSAVTMPQLSLLIGESQLKGRSISLLSTSCYFPTLRSWILSALHWYDSSPIANWNVNWPCLRAIS